jgi:hypothetical protein
MAAHLARHPLVQPHRAWRYARKSAPASSQRRDERALMCGSDAVAHMFDSPRLAPACNFVVRSKLYEGVRNFASLG